MFEEQVETKFGGKAFFCRMLRLKGIFFWHLDLNHERFG